MNILPVTYVSQLESNALKHNNDCGAACGVMMLRAFHPESDMTVDEFYDRCFTGGDQYLSVSQIASTLIQNQVFVKWQIGVKLPELFDLLSQGRPGIALINYGELVRAGLTERSGFTGAHFVVVVGIDHRNLYIHDPYQTGERGKALAVPLSVWSAAWGQCARQGNPNNGILVGTSLDVQPIEDDELYRIRVTASALTIRSGPGNNYPAVGYLRANDERNVYSEYLGWGKIADDQWASLTYTKRLP